MPAAQRPGRAADGTVAARNRATHFAWGFYFFKNSGLQKIRFHISKLLMQKPRSVTFVLPAARWDEIVAIAAREGRTTSGQIRLMIERYLDGPAGHDLKRMSDERVRKMMNSAGTIVDD